MERGFLGSSDLDLLGISSAIGRSSLSLGLSSASTIWSGIGGGRRSFEENGEGEEIWAKGFGKFLKAAKSVNFWEIEGGIKGGKVIFG